ncbi:MAG: hypothetical protein IKD10_01845 [Lentisphaeria bacterium]|nr:hypothetical protein [Lentisphaerota bacterium]MBR7143659.1 hypothetical protein [Lentisphaeria bacterium]
MKKVLLLLTAAFAVWTVSGAENLIKNGDFSEVDANGVPKHWSFYPAKMPAGASAVVDSTFATSGGTSVRFQNTELWHYTRIDQVVKVKPNTDYIAFFKSKGENITSPNGGMVRMYIGHNGNLDRPTKQFGPFFDYVKLGRPENWSYKWKKYESGVFNSGKNTAFGICLFLMRGKGTAWVDEVELYEYTPELRKEIEAGHARTLLKRDVEKLKANAKGDKEMLKKINAAEQRLGKWYPEVRTNKRSGFPFYKFQEELFALNAEILQRNHPGKTMLLTADSDAIKPYDHLPAKVKPFSGKVELSGVGNDIESFALNFTNTSKDLSVVTLVSDKKINLEIRKTTAVASDLNKAFDDALMPVVLTRDGKYRFAVPGGMTVQIYCTVFFPEKAGKTLSTLKWSTLRDSGSVDIVQNVIKAAFPEIMPIWSFSYLYRSRGIMHRHADATAKFLKRMHQNAHMLFHVTEFRPVFDENGKIQPGKMRWDVLDKDRNGLMLKGGMLIINCLYFHEPYLSVFLGKNKDGSSIKPFSPEWESRAGQYIKATVEGLKKRGVGYDRFVFFLRDEPMSNALPGMEKMAHFIRKVDPQIKISNNSNNLLNHKEIRRLAGFLDIQAPHIDYLTPEVMQILHDAKNEVWTYWVQNKSIPGSQLRDVFMKLKKQNIRAFSYWCAYDPGDIWDAAKQSYSVIFRNDDEWSPSKRAEGIREGIEDYTLLKMLEDKDPASYKEIINSITPENRPAMRKKILEKLNR